uniref:Uncharacterized protein n=1 Tax=Anguilla anguilla TaxID=7936 RepID=A0A0E9PZE3_ANGAN
MSCDAFSSTSQVCLRCPGRAVRRN